MLFPYLFKLNKDPGEGASILDLMKMIPVIFI